MSNRFHVIQEGDSAHSLQFKVFSDFGKLRILCSIRKILKENLLAITFVALVSVLSILYYFKLEKDQKLEAVALEYYKMILKEFDN